MKNGGVKTGVADKKLLLPTDPLQADVFKLIWFSKLAEITNGLALAKTQKISILSQNKNKGLKPNCLKNRHTIASKR